MGGPAHRPPRGPGLRPGGAGGGGAATAGLVHQRVGTLRRGAAGGVVHPDDPGHLRPAAGPAVVDPDRTAPPRGRLPRRRRPSPAGGPLPVRRGREPAAARPPRAGLLSGHAGHLVHGPRPVRLAAARHALPRRLGGGHRRPAGRLRVRPVPQAGRGDRAGGHLARLHRGGRGGVRVGLRRGSHTRRRGHDRHHPGLPGSRTDPGRPGLAASPPLRHGHRGPPRLRTDHARRPGCAAGHRDPRRGEEPPHLARDGSGLERPGRAVQPQRAAALGLHPGAHHRAVGPRRRLSAPARPGRGLQPAAAARPGGGARRGAAAVGLRLRGAAAAPDRRRHPRLAHEPLPDHRGPGCHPLDGAALDVGAEPPPAAPPLAAGPGGESPDPARVRLPGGGATLEVGRFLAGLLVTLAVGATRPDRRRAPGRARPGGAGRPAAGLRRLRAPPAPGTLPARRPAGGRRPAPRPARGSWGRPPT